jgi:branched-chain amino acid aminotransferase
MTDGTATDKPLLALVDGRLVDVREAAISVFDAGFQSGDAVWEGLRVYNGTVFRLDDHLHRLADSAKALKITLPLALEEIGAAVDVTLAANDLRHDAHVRLMVTRGTRLTSGMDPRNAPPTGTLVIVAERKPVPLQPAPQTLRTSSIRRPGPQTVDPGIHHANQLNSILARLEVQDTGVDAALMLDQDGYVAEADTANIFCVTNGRLRTPFATSCLHGITRGIVLGLGVDLDLSPREERLTLFDLYGADEVFITGTICELVPIVTIDDRPVGAGKPGPDSGRLLDAYRALVQRETQPAG